MIRRRRPRLATPGRLAVRLAVIAAVLSAVLAAVGPSVAEAAPGGCSPLDRGGTKCRIGGDVPAPTPGSTVVSSSSPPGPVFRPWPLLLPCDASLSDGWTPLADLDAAIFDLTLVPGSGDPVEPGELYMYELVDPRTGPRNSGYLACVGDSEPVPAPPPPPPTGDEIWQIWGNALTFDPSVNLDPYVRGLTGLETFMWYEGLTTDSLTLTIRGYTVQADLWTEEFRWDMGAESREGESAYASTDPGSPGNPAAAHTYAQPAEVIVVHETLWRGDATLTGPGLPAGGVFIDLGEAILATARAYDVIEVRTPVVNGQRE